MTTTNHAMPIVKPTTTTHSTSEKDKLIGKPRFHFEPKQVMQLLHAPIIGQDAALNEIEKMLHVVKADFSSPERPLSVTLMLGPTGVGKTETVRLIAEAIYGRPDAFCRIDMNTLAKNIMPLQLAVHLRAMSAPRKVIACLMKLRLQAVIPVRALYCLMNWKKPPQRCFAAL